MDTYIAYFDETGDDGANISSSNQFVLTGMYMNADYWRENYDTVRACRKELREKYGLHMSEEIHTKHLVRDKGMYRDYQWTDDERRDIIIAYAKCVASLNARIVNVIIDKTKVATQDYPVLKSALTYNIQRIENDSKGKWHYLIITDEGRLAPMRRIGRDLRCLDSLESNNGGYVNKPINGLIEDIMSKNSSESHFIQICDFVSFFSDLYYRTFNKNEEIPKRVARIIDREFIKNLMVTLKHGNVLNLKESNNHDFGFVIYPK